ncbi:MAG: aminodeoxychorismate/anthranilate synthase component II [Bacillota bacterium]|nr:aminodeoxychorismate/anthranilate synthase component II [Bacillota bacterium]
MILLIDNYDSFAYNLVQMMGQLDPDIRVFRNDCITLEQIEALAPDRLVLSPGPGRPADAGICLEVVRRFTGIIPILGVCLGHQAICEAFGATVSYAKTLMHGKQSDISLNQACPIFAGLPAKIRGARYHSLAVREETLPVELLVMARSDDGEVMAVQHRDKALFGVQFHPESILTPQGSVILENFRRIEV